MRRLITATVWLAAGHALVAAAYAGMIQTPDSSVPLLVLTATLVLAAMLLLLLTSASAARVLHADDVPWHGWSRVPAMLPGVMLAVLAVGFVGALATWGGMWWSAHAGQVDAAAIAAGDVTQTAWLHTGVRWAVAGVQWVLVPAWLAAALVWAAAYRTRDVASMKWLVTGLHPRVLLTTLAVVLVLVWLPWRVVYWRPPQLGTWTSWMEMTFIGLKLSWMYMSANLAWALVLDAASRVVRR